MGWWEVIKSRLLAQPQHSDEGPDEHDEMRLPARIRASCRVEDGPPHRVEIRSLSLNGLMFRAPQRVVRGQRVLLRVPLSGDLSKRTSEIVEVRARATWGRKAGEAWDVGVCYLEEKDSQRDEWLNRVLETYRVNLWDDRRQSLRHRVEVPVMLRRDSGHPLSGTVRNLSGGGMQVTLGSDELKPDDAIVVELCPLEELRVTLRGRVVNDVCKHGQHYVSVQFEDVDDTQRHLLLDVVVQTLKPAEPRLEE